MERPVRGFTLVELVVVLMVSGLLAALAAPSFAAMLERHRTRAFTHQLTASMALSRLGAVRLGQPVTLCPTRDGLRCRRDLAWEGGWMAYADPGRRDQPARQADILQHVPLDEGPLLARSSAGRHRIRFLPTGWSSGSNLSIRICSRGAAKLLGTVVVNNAGRPRTERQDNAPKPCPYPP
ncbi:GspH/FimT family protein [Arenimonas sp.]|uniref:GspH/FimT family protein n=1 Tax=Arenimonas sp. TaxID=1872635 RepID=UPI002E328CD0|nr:GspH/FimT family protein [Arenimonas sp.]HEX4853013.1 GspH/FimT family protein [Arenimonas sp.]